MKIVGSQLLVLISIIAIIYITGVESGESCRRKDVNGNEDVFSCPRLFESSKKKYCCGPTLQDKHCCEWSQKSKDIINNPSNVKFLFEGAVAIILLVLLIIGGLIICCCVCACCLLSRKRQSRGQVLSNSRAEAATTVTSVPNSVTTAHYPMQTNAYPMQNVTAPYPMEQPPPYSYNQTTQPPYNPSYPIK